MPLQSHPTSWIAVFLLAGLLVWSLIAILRFRNKYKKLKADMTALEAENSSGRQARIQLDHFRQELKAARSTAEKLQDQLRVLTGQLAQYREKYEQMKKVAAENTKLQQKTEHLKSELARQMAEEARLKTTLEKERQLAAEKIDFLDKAQNRLETEFQNLANKILEEKSSRFAEQNRLALNNLLLPLKDQLAEFKRRIEQTYDQESRDRAALTIQIARLKELNQRLAQEAIELTQALKGDSKVQGNWGEVVLERVLESSGLAKGREYLCQVNLHDGDGKRFRPDVIIYLPGDRQIIIDAKVSLRAWHKYHGCRDDQCRAAAMQQHIRALREHVFDLAAKQYNDLDGVHSPDFVLMFLPMEAAFIAASQHDPSLFDQALENRVVIVSPSTLLVTLKTVANIWRNEHQNRNAAEIARQAGSLHDKFVGFVEVLQDVGNKLDKAKDAYLVALQRLVNGRGNLVRKVAQLRQMGVKTAKQLPAGLLDAATKPGRQGREKLQDERNDDAKP